MAALNEPITTPLDGDVFSENVLVKIHKKRAAVAQFDIVPSQDIQNYLVCLSLCNDEDASIFCDDIKKHFKESHPIEFVQLQSGEELAETVASIIETVRVAYTDGMRWATKCVLVCSDAKRAIEVIKDTTINCIALCLNKEHDEEYHPSVIYLPECNTDVEQSSEERLLTAAVWLLCIIQNNYFMPYEDGQGLARNVLTGYVYDCVEQRMRCETYENLQGLLSNSPEEQERFYKKVMLHFSEESQDLFTINTQAYENLVRQFHEELPHGFLRRLLCYLSHSYRRKHCKWSLSKTTQCGVVFSSLYGERYKLDEREFNDIYDKQFAACWKAGKEEILNTTLSTLIDAVTPNGVFNTKVEELRKESLENRRLLERESQTDFLPKGRTVREIRGALQKIEEIHLRQETIFRNQRWLSYVKKQISDIITQLALVKKREQYEKWYAQLGTIEVAKERSVYQWDADPIPEISSAKLTDTEDDRFNVDAGMFLLNRRLNGKTGQLMLCTAKCYQKLEWDKPSIRTNFIDQVIADRFTFLSGLSDTDLILLCMDAD